MTRLEAAAIWAPTLAVVTVAMEYWAGLLHRRAWHGPLWSVHRTHHEPHSGWLEKNDALSFLHAPIAIALILFGCFGEPGVAREIAYGAGLGMTLFGALYMVFHDGLVHGRLPVGFLRRFDYVDVVCRAHAVHHQKNGGPYGFFHVPAKLRARLEADRLRASRGAEA